MTNIESENSHLTSANFDRLHHITSFQVMNTFIRQQGRKTDRDRLYTTG